MTLRSDRVDTLIQGNFPPDGAPSLLSAFSGADASHPTASPKQSFEDELAEYGASIEVAYGQETTLQDLRDLSVKLAKMEQEDEYRNALAGILSGRNIDAFLHFLTQKTDKIQAKDRKARAEAHYMALLHAQMMQLQADIKDLGNALDYLRRTGDVEGTINMPKVKDAIKRWEEENGKKFDPNAPDAREVLDQIIEDHMKDKQRQHAELDTKRDQALALGDELAQSKDTEEYTQIVQTTHSATVNTLTGQTTISLEDKTNVFRALGHENDLDTLNAFARGETKALPENIAPGLASDTPEFARGQRVAEFNEVASQTQTPDSTQTAEVDAQPQIPDFAKGLS